MRDRSRLVTNAASVRGLTSFELERANLVARLIRPRSSAMRERSADGTFHRQRNIGVPAPPATELITRIGLPVRRMSGQTLRVVR